ncbi:MAG: adenylate/guanylate cyclase domain-containing response regulator [Gammaproteobacteria bacterium]|nr:adenylate/guanylate cyclase domain-containing response regulator [Gammaproteobacteria bacterium]
MNKVSQITDIGMTIDDVGGQTVLIIDNESSDQTLCFDCLKDRGYVVITAVDTPAGLRSVARHRPDLVLISHELVRSQSQRVARGIKALSGRASTPVMMYGVAIDDNTVAQAGDGIDYVLHAPLERDQLMHSVTQVLERSVVDATLKPEKNIVPHNWLNHFVAPQVVEEIEQCSRGDASWSPLETYHEVKAAALFADIRGYTRATEMLEPEWVMKLLNAYYRMCTQRCEAAGGAVLSIAGDRIMACFGAPEPLTDVVSATLSAALSIQQRFSSLSTDYRQRYGVEIGLGIGIDYGPMLAGFVGSKTQLQYTIIGRTVNVAARLETLAPSGGILMSENARTKLPSDLGRVQLRTLSDFQIRGLIHPQTVYCIQAG